MPSAGLRDLRRRGVTPPARHRRRAAGQYRPLHQRPGYLDLVPVAEQRQRPHHPGVGRLTGGRLVDGFADQVAFGAGHPEGQPVDRVEADAGRLDHAVLALDGRRDS